ncbi:chromatin associated protein KTI12 [Ascobolus immersus RN42]|uniref:Chromatin associated protein KTI12 n=1 Tax=Ascobolus immersus RN42 TaxID=1160509 RepID=A0A3N4IFI0_ASCIM|nr:chromatin associated protein KTI12 [Ascobolus immersus RN42]
MICGLPSSGKTTRAKQIQKFFEDRIAAAKLETDDKDSQRIARFKVHYFSDETLGLEKEMYRDAKREKMLRAAQYSAAKRALGKEDVVIADFPNYIKGYRYQLYCEAKSYLTPSCVVHVGAPADKCEEWNNARPESERYADDLLKDLIFRFEEPNGMTRWDSPLFTVPYVDDEPEMEGIWEAMMGKKKVRPNQATVLKSATDSDYLHNLDKYTQEVVAAVMRYQGGGRIGGDVTVEGSEAPVTLPEKTVPGKQFQTLRRQFINLQRQNPIHKDRLKSVFVDFLNEQLAPAQKIENPADRWANEVWEDDWYLK